MRSGLALLIFAVSTLVAAHPKDNGSGGDNDAQNAAVSSTASSTAAAASATASGSNSTSGLTGETICMAALMCISAVVNGSTVEYTLQSTGAQTLGWMAMGFGTTMAGSPMVIMWPNADNSITLSQRLASGETMPIVDSNPPRAATLQESLSDLSGSTPKMVYTIPANSDTQQNIIWAFGTTNPGDSSPSANLLMHINSGPTSIDLTKPLSTSSNSSNPAADPSSNSAPVIVTPLMPYEKMIVKHAILSVVGFLGLLPAGALLARYLRTFSSTWFNGHWIFQFALAGPVIIAGVALGIASVAKEPAAHLADDHMRWGVAIFVLYFVQITLGAVIHWIKPKSWTVGKKRPLQNYFHAVLGLIIIALAFMQVRTGYKHEWVHATGREPISNAANIVWYIWIVLLPLLYLGGLAFLPRQFRQEQPAKAITDEDGMAMAQRGYSDEPRYTDRPEEDIVYDGQAYAAVRTSYD